MFLLGLLKKYRILLGILGLLCFNMIIYVLLHLRTQYDLVKVDYLIWATFILITAAVICDLHEYRRYTIASTVMLDVVALVLVSLARIIPLIQVIFTCVNCPLIGGGVSNTRFLVIILPLLGPGTVIATGTLLLHKIRHGPVILGEVKYTLDDLYLFIQNLLIKITDYMAKHVIITGFIVGFLIRIVPEIMWWPWPIGCDTIEYIAHLRDFTVNPNPFVAHYWIASMRNIPPLLNMILYPFTFIADPWWIFKFYPPIAYGLLVAVMGYSVKTLTKTNKNILLAVILVSALHILNLKISYEVHRQLLATILFIPALTLLEQYKDSLDTRKHYLIAVLFLLSALAHEMMAVLSFIVLSLFILTKIYYYKENMRKITSIIAIYAGIAIASLYLVSWYIGWYPGGRQWINPVLQTPKLPGTGVYREPSNVASDVLAYVIITYGLLMPLLFLAFERYLMRLKYYMTVPLILLLAGISPILMSYTAAASWHRMFIGAAPFIVPFATSCINIYKKKLFALLYIIVLIMPGFFMALHPQGWIYDRKYIEPLENMPETLAPFPSSEPYLQDLLQLSKNVSRLNRSIPIVIARTTIRWVHLELRNPDPRMIIVTYNPTLVHVCRIMTRLNTTKAYLISPADGGTLLRHFRNYLNNTKARNETVVCGPYTDNVSFNLTLVRNGIYKIYLVTIENPAGENKG
ncbi:hypothetical protein J4526_03890 [Desulfurococcaceae archaeon MEX13E-LK6-19]|nr:hypothetical protein J4526_03890 [Desulfurococcaceae archaeon MEX13E-LK6-19]